MVTNAITSVITHSLITTFEKLKALLKHSEDFDKNKCKSLYRKIQILNWITLGAIKSLLKKRNISLEKEELLKAIIQSKLSHHELLSRTKFLVKDLKIKPRQEDIEQCCFKAHFMTAGYLLNHIANSDKIIENIACKYQTQNRKDIPESKRYSKEQVKDFLIKWQKLGRIYVPGLQDDIQTYQQNQNFFLQIPK